MAIKVRKARLKTAVRVKEPQDQPIATLRTKMTGEDLKESQPKEPHPRASSEDDTTKPKLTNGQWWRAEELNRKPHEIVDHIYRQIEDDQEGRYSAYKEWERLFGITVTTDGDDSFRSALSQDFTQNILQNTIESLWAQVFKNKIAPAVAANEADFDEWERGKALSRWLEGAFDDADVYSEVLPVFGANLLVSGTASSV